MQRTGKCGKSKLMLRSSYSILKLRETYLMQRTGKCGKSKVAAWWGTKRVFRWPSAISGKITFYLKLQLLWPGLYGSNDIITWNSTFFSLLSHLLTYIRCFCTVSSWYILLCRNCKKAIGHIFVSENKLVKLKVFLCNPWSIWRNGVVAVLIIRVRALK